MALFISCTNKQIIEADSPILLAKSIKNEVEIEGLRQCHRRDAAALVFQSQNETPKLTPANKRSLF